MRSIKRWSTWRASVSTSMWESASPLPRPPPGLSFFDDVVKRMLTKRQVQAQLLGRDAERGEHARVADGDGAFTRGEAGARGARDLILASTCWASGR